MASYSARVVLLKRLELSAVTLSRLFNTPQLAGDVCI
jgi:hypothetical protein